MLGLAASSAMVLAALWLLVNDSGLMVLAVFLATTLALLGRLLLGFAAAPRMPVAALVGVLVGLSPLGWYMLRQLFEPVAVATGYHYYELTGAVLPGVVLGAALATDLWRPLGWPLADARRQRYAVALRRALVLNGMVALATALFLLSRARDNIFLISAILLPGADSYQVLGDMLTINLVSVLVLLRTGAAADAHGRTPMSTRLLAGFAVWAAAATSAVLLGSNKLLLVCLMVALFVALPMFARLARRRPLTLAFSLAAVGVAAWVHLAGLEEGALADLLALTRLLDYGNVESLLDTPSIASRLEILQGCAAQQFALGPLFGDLAAEYRTCGEGHYLHSLVSVQTHLGLVGTLLFLGAVALGAWNLGGDPALRRLRPVLAIVLFVALASAFFTWLPVWHALALLAAAPYGLAPARGATAAQRCSAQT